MNPDTCFWIRNALHFFRSHDFDREVDPPPNLAVEIEITSRLGAQVAVYERLKVSEAWRFDGTILRVLVLGDKGQYAEVPRSESFPDLPMDALVEWILRGRRRDETAWAKEFRAWPDALPRARPPTRRGANVAA